MESSVVFIPGLMIDWYRFEEMSSVESARLGLEYANVEAF